MQENSVTVVPVSGVTASGLGSAVVAGGTSGIIGNTVNTNNTSSNSSSTSSNSNGSSGNTNSNNGPPGSGPVVPSTAAGSGGGATTISPHGLSDIDQAQFEADKRAVYKHPLFSLLALLLEKCEQATQGYIPSSSSASSPNGSTNNGTGDGDSFSRDIQAFVQLLEKEKRPLLTNNSELDGLMIKALQVLRIHLLELEKVQELCRDFCTRYIACLRSKMQSENLLRSDYALEHNNNLSNSNSPINSPEQDLSGSAQGYYQNADYLQGSDTSEYSNMQGKRDMLSSGLCSSGSQHPLPSPQPGLLQEQSNPLHPFHQHHHQVPSSVATSLADLPHPVSPNTLLRPSSDLVPEESVNLAASVALGCGVAIPGLPSLATLEAAGPMLATAAAAMAFQHQQHQHHLHQQQQQQQYEQTFAGTTLPGMIGCPPAIALTSPLDVYAGQLSPCGSSDELDSELDSPDGDGDSSSGKRQKRGILPKHATSVMRAWLFQHLVHPYPTEDEKRAVAAQTNLTLLQVNNWFINARRRILLPMLENASDNSGE
ncbi:homeobox protein unc-62-like [Anopheles ziemanni]|uniref:homeobox protein unc-62-like n=1 Tax=Anopheles coustani TaxID=139045 RepID=UPI002659DA4E|nr:homeobox protein unc-62-like [Anopheles coustani]XP_058166654.1 homeobox protein unc-62-like [Anopheles ziemanni]